MVNVNTGIFHQGFHQDITLRYLLRDYIVILITTHRHCIINIKPCEWHEIHEQSVLLTLYNSNNNDDLLRVNHVQDTSQPCKVSGINPIFRGVKNRWLS